MANKSKKRAGRRAGSFRTCVACRARLPRGASLRLVRTASTSGPGEAVAVPDLYQKLPGRGVHLCPRLACLEKSMSGQLLSWAFKAPTRPADPREMFQTFVKSSLDQVKSVLATAARAGWLVPGRSAVLDALDRHELALIILASDAGGGVSRDIAAAVERARVDRFTLFTVADLASFHGGKPLAVVGVLHRGVASRLAEVITLAVSLIGSAEPAPTETRSELTRVSGRGKMPKRCAG